MVVLAVLIVAATALQVLNPQVVRYYVDRATTAGAVPLLVNAALAYIVIAAVLQAVRILGSYVGESVAWSMTNSVRTDLARHCVALDFQFHRDHTPGELVERVDGDVTALGKFLSSSFAVIVANLLLVVGIFVSLFVTDWRIGIALALYAACAMGILFWVRTVATTAWTRVREVSAELFGFLTERQSSVEDIRSNAAEAYVLDRLDRHNDDMLRWQQRARLKAHSIFLSMHGTYLIGYGGALALGAYLYTRGMTTIGTVYLIVAYTNFIYTPLNELRTQIQDLQRANASVIRVQQLLGLAPTVVGGSGRALPAGALSVEFEDVSFSYSPTGPVVLRDIGFQVPAATVLGILGRTGSGKTTIARLVARMYDPTAGTVRLGGVPVREPALADVRARVGMVTQDVQLFHGTVRDNVTLFDDAVSTEQVLAAIHRLGLQDWIDRLPDGLETVLEAGEGRLSAGEAQLLGVCRVFLRQPSVVILDEASSRLDPATEALLEQALTVLLEGRTALLIAHRLSTLMRADHLLVVEDGRLVESGPRSALLDDPDSRLSRLFREMAEEGR